MTKQKRKISSVLKGNDTSKDKDKVLLEIEDQFPKSIDINEGSSDEEEQENGPEEDSGGEEDGLLFESDYEGSDGVEESGEESEEDDSGEEEEEEEEYSDDNGSDQEDESDSEEDEEASDQEVKLKPVLPLTGSSSIPSQSKVVGKELATKEVALPNVVADEYEDDTSDEEDIRNTVGNIPMHWYDEYKHIGYDWDAKKIIGPNKGDQIDDFIKRMEDPNFWRTVKDPQTGQNVVLTDEDIATIKQITSQRFPDSHDQFEVISNLIESSIIKTTQISYLDNRFYLWHLLTSFLIHSSPGSNGSPPR